MRKVLAARSPFEAHLVAHVLRDAGLEVVVEGEPLQGALGELPLDLSTMPAVLVVHDEDLGRALRVLEEHKRTVAHGRDADASAS